MFWELEARLSNGAVVIAQGEVLTLYDDWR
jgi:hypothetical protein